MRKGNEEEDGVVYRKIGGVKASAVDCCISLFS